MYSSLLIITPEQAAYCFDRDVGDLYTRDADTGAIVRYRGAHRVLGAVGFVSRRTLNALERRESFKAIR